MMDRTEPPTSPSQNLLLLSQYVHSYLFPAETSEIHWLSINSWGHGHSDLTPFAFMKVGYDIRSVQTPYLQN